MDVFHVTNLDGNKLTDGSIINCIEQSLGTIHNTRSKSIDGITTLELTGTDRVGLLSEVFAVLSELNCDVVESKVWTHNGRITSIIHLTHVSSTIEIGEDNDISVTTRVKLKMIFAKRKERTRIYQSWHIGMRQVEEDISQEEWVDRLF
ncbi:ACT domain-containing protein ACR8-like [Bidens hawaiensis]|uniref:ACT domain-containing protein ACR8-like n=1 Tax=Bidens hawaiensis TaxID=980011 RepID=UPI0040498E87